MTFTQYTPAQQPHGHAPTRPDTILNLLPQQANGGTFETLINGHLEEAGRIRDNATAAMDRIAQRRALSDTAKTTACARIFEAAQQALTTHQAAGWTAINTYRQGRVDKAFGTPPASPADVMAARQARTMAAAITDQDAALDAIRDARQNGDLGYAKAVAGHAYANGWHPAVDEWNHDGTHNDAVAGLREVATMPDTTAPQWRLNFTMAHAINPPTILARLDPHQIAAAARDTSTDEQDAA